MAAYRGRLNTEIAIRKVSWRTRSPVFFVYMMNCSDAIKSAGGDCDKVEVKILWKTEIRLTFRQLEGVA